MPTNAYLRAKSALNPNALVALRYVEESIAEDPDHRERRHERTDGAVIDWSAQGLFVAFRCDSPDSVQLLDVIDLKEAHRWA
jgi:hypothetical protein